MTNIIINELTMPIFMKGMEKGKNVTASKKLDKYDYENLAGDIQEWLLFEKGIVANIKVE